ncbi:MAG TPA: bifunctional diaminohydroxyphosphoribosylaminopyrimidine deaminase/5-amino-6-(5-phosphoribosylamino)uracil reductase RibD [Vicinamibacterales bacterium]|nr:bifunctional diaminohydroxyphosphoribosylaminopyrimidine deaminase/5-amino-6-(5-phosphoribosylamino)uracil reductase RibD [Vicinamibacterales bacterium]
MRIEPPHPRTPATAEGGAGEARDAFFMRRALALAERGRGHTNPNPMVGALVVDARGVIVGRGAHRVAGGPHAEVFALAEAGERAVGGTLYCTLEPCSHHGRTGPCAPLVADAGIRRAVIAMDDPNPVVDGRGLAHLRDRGIAVESGIMGAAAARQNEVFLTNVLLGRPFVVAKIALSLDGNIAGPGGARTQLTGAAAHRIVQRQRAEVDALAVGSSTVLGDDPLLTPRGAWRGRPLARVIFDRRLRTPPGARVLSTVAAGPIIVMTDEACAAAHPERVRALEHAGARVAVAPGGIGPSFSWLLREAGISSIVVEGGSTLHRALFEAGLVDAVHAYIAPVRLGPEAAAWMDPQRFSLSELVDREAAWFGADVRVEGHVHRHH